MVRAKEEKVQKGGVKEWLAEIKKRNIAKEKICQIKETINKLLGSKLVVKV